jgi:hypothetical protein
MKFKCIKGCEAEILFEDIKKHYNWNFFGKEVYGWSGILREI